MKCGKNWENPPFPLTNIRYGKSWLNGYSLVYSMNIWFITRNLFSQSENRCISPHPPFLTFTVLLPSWSFMSRRECITKAPYCIKWLLSNRFEEKTHTHTNTDSTPMWGYELKISVMIWIILNLVEKGFSIPSLQHEKGFTKHHFDTQYPGVTPTMQCQPEGSLIIINSASS